MMPDHSILLPLAVGMLGAALGSYFMMADCGLLLPLGMLASALVLNLHQLLWGSSLSQALRTSRPLPAVFNWAVGRLVRRALSREGVPCPDRTEVYSHGRRWGRADVYEPPSSAMGGSAQRPAVLYFHGGAFIAGLGGLGAGQCARLASHGTVCLSVSYRLTGQGCGVAATLPASGYW